MQGFTRLAGLTAIALMSTGLWASDTQDPESAARQHWHESIGSGYQRLATEADGFRSAADAYCKSPTENRRIDAEQAWLDAFLAWQKVRFVDFGPVESSNLAWQFQFWPDPKNLVARKAGYLLNPEQEISPEAIEQSGVAVQGFPMAEYLLFDEPLNKGKNALPAARTCKLLGAVSGHIATNGRQLSKQWQSFKEHYLATDQYRDTTIRGAMAALEILEERRLAKPMGLRGNGSRSAYAADAWRSGTSLKTAEATIDGLRQHFFPGLERLLAQSSQPELAERIDRQFVEVLENFPNLHAPISSLLADDAEFARLQSFYVDVSQLANLVNEQAAVALGVVRGFNSSDGD